MTVGQDVVKMDTFLSTGTDRSSNPGVGFTTESAPDTSLCTDSEPTQHGAEDVDSDTIAAAD